TCTLSYTMSKTDDRMIPCPVSQDSPGSVSTSETPLRKMSKAVAPRDTKLDSGTQLTERNLSSVPGLFREKSPQTVPFQIRQAHNMLGSGIWAGVLLFGDSVSPNPSTAYSRCPLRLVV